MSVDIHGDPGAAPRALFISAFAFSSLFVGLRFWSRAVVLGSNLSFRARFWWDDYIAALTLPFIAAENAIGIHLTFLGLGQHVSDVQPSIVSTFLKLLYINYPIYDFAVTLPKISALLFYARVFSARTNASLRYVLWITGALSVLWLVAAVFIAGFQCTPTYKAWDTAVSGTCIGTFQWWLPTATISATIDLIILLIPMPLLWKLRLRPLKKFGLLWVFALGYSVIVVQIGRLIVLSKIGVKLDEDVTFQVVQIGHWLHLEAAFSVASICLPATFSLIKRGTKFGPKFLFTSRCPEEHRKYEDEEELTKSDDVSRGIVITLHSLGREEAQESVRRPSSIYLHNPRSVL